MRWRCWGSARGATPVTAHDTASGAVIVARDDAHTWLVAPRDGVAHVSVPLPPLIYNHAVWYFLAPSGMAHASARRYVIAPFARADGTATLGFYDAETLIRIGAVDVSRPATLYATATRDLMIDGGGPDTRGLLRATVIDRGTGRLVRSFSLGHARPVDVAGDFIWAADHEGRAYRVDTRDWTPERILGAEPPPILPLPLPTPTSRL